MKLFTRIWGLMLLLSLWGPARAQTINPVPPDSAIYLPQSAASCREAVIAWKTRQGAPVARYHGKYSLLVVQEVAVSNAAPSPQQGQYYLASMFFGAGVQLVPGQFAVYADTGHVATVRNLKANTAYRADVIAYTDSADSFPSSPPLYAALDSTATLFFTTPGCASSTAPTQGASGASAVVVDCSTARLSSRPGNGDGRLLVVQRVPSGSDPATLSTQPADGQFSFPSNLYSQGESVGPEAYAVALGPDSTATLYGLRPGERYKFVAYEYLTERDPLGNPTGANPGYASPVDTAYFDVPLCSTAEPATAATNARQTDTTATTARVQWTNGSGTHRLVVLQPLLNAAGMPLPTQGTVYTPSASFGTGSAVNGNAYVVAAGADSSLVITNLAPSSFYRLAVYEYDLDAAGVPTYLLSQKAAGCVVQTYAPPIVTTTPPTNLSVGIEVAFTYNQALIELHWKKGSGTHWLAIVREVRDNRPPLLEPVDGTTYSNRVNSDMTPRSSLGQGSYLLMRGNYQSNANDTVAYLRNPSIGHVYEVAIWEYTLTQDSTGNQVPDYTASTSLTFASPRFSPSARGTLTANVPTINWSVDAQYLSRRFEVYSSVTGLPNTFQPTGIRTAVTRDSVTTFTSYSSTLPSPITGPMYYQVRMMHEDGTELESNTVRLAPERPLPVTLVRFTGTVRNGYGWLSWQTASETNSRQFDVERSLDGRSFQLVGTLPAAGTTTRATSYEKMDTQPLSGLTYYRLRQVDLDGTEHYSAVLTLRPGAVATDLQVWPVPAQTGEQVHLRLSGLPALSGPVSVRVHSAASAQLLLEQQLPAAASVEYSWSVADYAPGVYLVEVQTSAGRWVRRLLVQ